MSLLNTRSPGPVGMVLGAIASVQIGAAFAKQLFGEVPPTSMTWLRLVSATLLLLLARPLLGRRPPRPTREEPGTVGSRWLIALAFAAALVGMNWSIYQAASHIPLGIAVTLEFLGPLAVAIVGSRRPLDLLWAGLAGAGVLALGWSPTALNVPGVAFALLAGACWAGYILLGARLGRHWSGLDALTLACALGAIVLAAPAIAHGGAALWQPRVLITGLAVGLLSSVLPYSLELAALRQLPPRVFSILMSLEPVVAALAAWVILREALGPIEAIAIGLIVAASIGATARVRRPMAPEQAVG